MTACATIFNRYYLAPKRASSGSSPTVLLNAAYLADTLLNEGATPCANGEQVDSWAAATGGTFNFTRAELAGAAGRPLFITASGVHTSGGNCALTVATPITIPDGQDFRLYVSFKLTAGNLWALGNTNKGGRLEMNPVVGLTLFAVDGHSITLASAIPTGSNVLLRILRSGTSYTAAWTGTASAAMTDGSAHGTDGFEFNTLLGYSDSESTLDQFSDSGNYLRTLKIEYGVGTADTAYETAINGSPL